MQGKSAANGKHPCRWDNELKRIALQVFASPDRASVDCASNTRFNENGQHQVQLAQPGSKANHAGMLDTAGVSRAGYTLLNVA